LGNRSAREANKKEAKDRQDMQGEFEFQGKGIKCRVGQKKPDGEKPNEEEKERKVPSNVR